MATFTHALADTYASAVNLTVGVTPVAGVYTTTGTETAGDVIQLFKTNENQQVIELRVANQALGAGVTLQGGDGVDTDRYIKSWDASVADINQIDNEAAQIAPYPYPGNDTVDLLIGGGTLDASKSIAFVALLANLPS